LYQYKIYSSFYQKSSFLIDNNRRPSGSLFPLFGEDQKSEG
jgi:hypothetical protein